MDEEYRLKYLMSGLLFAFALSTTFLPFLSGIADWYSFHVWVEVFGICLITFGNYVYIALLKESHWRRFNIPLLIVINFCFMFFILPNILPLRVEGNVVAFSMIFLFIPWLILILFASVKHVEYCVDHTKQKNDISKNSANKPSDQIG